ncbi:MAG: Gfo/Idh/MocA family oxidoreductase [Armatimonadota bacterium]
MRFGIIGVGGIGGRHLNTIERHPDTEATVVCDVDEEALEQYKPTYDTTTRWEDVVGHDDVDAIVAALPHHLYPEVVGAALRAGIHVLKEKPFARNLDDARKMVNAASHSGAHLMVCGQSKYQPGFQRAYRILQSGVLGSVFMIRGVITYRWSKAFANNWGWRGNRELSGGVAIIDSGWHMLDIMTWYLGLPATVYATTGRGQALPGEYDVDDRAVLTMEYEKGAVGNAICSFICMPSERSVTVHGSEGSLEVTAEKTRLHLGNQTDAEVVTFQGPDDHLRPQLDNFLRMTGNDGERMSGVSQALQVQTVIEAAYRSAEIGRPVSISDMRPAGE